MKKFETFGVMIDLSRNAVMTVDAMKRYFLILKKMGYNCAFLYTEDTYEVDGEPYFGYMRGRYTKDEMKEIDEFGASVGIEVIPCIQTLAHLNTIAKWGKYPMDTPGILLCKDERVYQLIDNMFKTLSECFRTRRIHIGMDEAHMLGRGKHLDLYGYQTNAEIIKDHLNRVCKIAEKYNYEPMIWSDMLFRPWNNGEYYTGRVNMPKEYVEAVPKNVSPVYWDYYSPKLSQYSDMMYNHMQINKNTWFAGGVWTWGGFAPFNNSSIDKMKAAIDAAKEHKIKHVFMTLWGDNGAECSKLSAIPGLFYLAQYAKGVTDEEVIKSKFKSMFGLDYEDYILIDSPNDIYGEPTPRPYNPSKFMLYADYFNGFTDSSVKEGVGEKFKAIGEKLAAVAKKSRKYGYIFDTEAKLCDVLYKKAELGVKTRRAYKAGNKEELLRLAKEDYQYVQKALAVFYKAFEKQWMQENNPCGFDVQDIRLGGLMKRTESCQRRLVDYATGKLSSIPELEVELLDYNATYFNNYASNATSNPL